MKRALLIGIDKYPRLNQLEGCVNDVRLMRSILRDNFGFPAENLTLLADGQATRDAILTAFDALVEQTGRDDIVVVHYAGHGSQMTDREGDEPDGLDETIMPYDSEGRWGVNRDITDDEIHLRLLGLGEKTPYTTLVFDSCHSGTITRDAFGVKSRSVEPDTRPASELPPSPIPRELWAGLRGEGPSGWAHLSDRYVLIAGCRDEETSFEYRPPEGKGEVVHGAMTYFLCGELSRAIPGASYRDVFERVAAQVNAANPKQHPQMEGRADHEIFGVTDLEPMRFVPIVARAGDAVTLGAGLAQGMTVGSTFSVYPQGTKRTAGVTPLGEIAITGVRAVAAEAEIVAEDRAGVIDETARAVESVHAYGDLRLSVQLAAAGGSEAAVERLRGVLAASELLEVVGTGEPASMRAYLLPPRAGASADDPVPQLGAVKSPSWAVVDGNGQLLMPLKREDALAGVRENLEKVARYRQSLALENPDPGSALAGKFSLELRRRKADGTWAPALPEPAGGEVPFDEGEAIAFRITSRHDAPVFVSLLDFGLTGRVQVVFPPKGAKEQLAPGTTFSIGTGPGDPPWRLGIPNEFPFAADPTGANAVDGVETLKLFVTTGEADFSFLEQEGVRSGRKGGIPPLERLWRAAANGTRDMVKLPVGGDDWTTLVRPFLVRRPGAVPLSPDGRTIRVGDATLSSSGLAGRATAHRWMSTRADAAQLTTDALTQALQTSGARVQQTIEIANTRAATIPGQGEPVLEVRVPDPGPDDGQMILAADELGLLSWHFAPPPAGARQAEPTRRYRIPASVPAARPRLPTTRGLVGAVGSKFLKVIVFPLVEPGIGAVSESFALRWEQKHRPYRVRTFTPDDYATTDAAEVDADGWKRLSGGHALLMIHGTFSRAHSAFGALPRDLVAALHQRYEGRVFAFDHFTLAHDPKQNGNELLDRLPDGISLDLDIVCHSRGGLVARVLAERQGDLRFRSQTVRVGKVVFVGTPNAGTALADADHVGDFLDSYTNLLNFIPDAGLTDVLAVIVTAAKQVAVGAVKGLSGLQSMRPGGDFATWLNRAGQALGDSRYFALASDFTPGEPGLRELAMDRLMDRVFQRRANDLVVPTESVSCDNGSSCFPIEQRFVFQGSDAVGHTGYFAARGTQERLMDWLGAPVGAGA